MNQNLMMGTAAALLSATALLLSPLKTIPAPPDLASAQARFWRSRLAERRLIQLDRLHRYALRGVYPHNVDFPADKTPYFIDAAGTPCAVANLIIESGGLELAKKVAFEDNHVRVGSLKDGPVVDWILASGLLQEEAARIQPSYAFMHQTPEQAERRAEAARIHLHLLSVEAELREESETALDLATGRLLERLQRDPGFSRALLPPARELPPRRLSLFGR